jgi:fructose-1,6-bisphosphatase
MRKKIDKLDSELRLVVEKYENNAPEFKHDFTSIFDRFSYFSSVKKEFITELNFYIEPFLSENEKQMTIDEISYLNSMISKHERTLLYGFKFPSDLEK